MTHAGDQNILLSETNRNEATLGVCFEFSNSQKIDFLLTYQCNAACAHCITDSNPYRTEWLSEIEVLRVLSAGRQFGKDYISFTGGEPLMRLPLALRLIRAAKSLGYFVASDTNAYWGGSAAKAQDIAMQLRDAGLDALFPSADAYHLPYIPLSSMRNVIEACDKVGLVCEVNYCPGPNIDQNTQIIEDLNLRERGFFSDGLSLTGRDVTALKTLFPERRVENLFDVGSMHLGISPRGDCYANVDISYDCNEYVGTPFELGNIRREPIEQILERETREPLIEVMQECSPALVQKRLCAIGGGKAFQDYLNSLSEKPYYSATEYWLDLFHSPFAQKIIEELRTQQVLRDVEVGS